MFSYHAGMDINLLTLNLGNTRLAIGVFTAGELKHVSRLPVQDRAPIPAAIAAAWKLISDSPRAAIAAAGVNPELVKWINQTVHEQTGQTPLWVGRDMELPINVLTDAPNETGIDRVLNIAAAYEQMEKSCVVVDAGTAVTVDFCNDNGDFLGGAIAPGLRMMLTSLHEKTARLPLVEFAPPTGSVGANTASAIRHGVYNSIRGLVKEMVESYAMAEGHWPEIIATGGDAEALFKGWELIHAVAPDLTLYGIALAFTEHHIRHDS
jgi:type III pantothenate kinase